MKIYKANGNRQFEVSDTDAPDASLVKLKISTILPSSSDFDVFCGRAETKYPRVPCHLATAVVSEDRNEYGLKRGAKVILNPYILSTIDSEGLGKVGRYGLDADGFLRDFIAMPIDNIIPFPEDVKENEALFTEIIAVALATLNTFSLEKGDYIAVAGDSVLANVIAQLALYYQAIPILIAKDDRFLSLAEKCGIYYTINECHEDTSKRVLSMTGGRMADHTVLHAKTGATSQFLCTLTKRGGDAIITGLNPNYPRLDVDVGQIVKKGITLKGVSSGASEIISAVNILAQKQLKLVQFVDKVAPFAEAETLFTEETEVSDRYIAAVIKV